MTEAGNDAVSRGDGRYFDVIRGNDVQSRTFPLKSASNLSIIGKLHNILRR